MLGLLRYCLHALTADRTNSNSSRTSTTSLPSGNYSSHLQQRVKVSATQKSFDLFSPFAAQPCQTATKNPTTPTRNCVVIFATKPSTLHIQHSGASFPANSFCLFLNASYSLVSFCSLLMSIGTRKSCSGRGDLFSSLRSSCNLLCS